MGMKLAFVGVILLLSVVTAKRCAKELRKIHAANGKGSAPLGQFKPKCDRKGDYMTVQSHEGYNWCVNQNSGVEIEHTRKRFGKPDCKKVINDVCHRACGYNYDPVCGSDRVKYDNKCLFKIANCTTGGSLKITKEGECQTHQCIVEKRKLEQEPARLGKFIPRCDDEGDYEQIQSHENYNFCVDKVTGQEVENTRKSGFDTPICTTKTCKANGKLFRVGDQTKEVDNCNWCTCMEEGHWACTKMACIGKKPIKMKAKQSKPFASSGPVESKCWSLFDGLTQHKYGCSVHTTVGGLISIGGDLDIKLSFDHCKDPLQASVYKRSSNVFGQDKTLSRSFTQKDNIYHQDDAGLKVEFDESFDGRSVNVTLYLVSNGDDTKVMQGTFPTDKSDCSWYDKMSNKSQMALILGVSIPPLCIFFIVLRVFLRKKCQRKPEQNVGVYAVMRT